MEQKERSNLPQHIAFIVDGNRRWAKKNGLSSWRGHQKGAEVVRAIARRAAEIGIPFITFWVLSEDNLKKRSKEEVGFLMELFAKFCRDILADPEIKKKEVAVRFIGRWKTLLPKKAVEAAEEVEEKTKKFNKRILTILLAYDGCQEMLNAIQSIKERAGEFPVTPETIKEALWTGYLPPVDLLIRTGGEPHWSSGFMMWQTANSEFYFTKTLAPDFGEKELEEALAEYELRRRMGGA